MCVCVCLCSQITEIISGSFYIHLCSPLSQWTRAAGVVFQTDEITNDMKKDMVPSVHKCFSSSSNTHDI